MCTFVAEMESMQNKLVFRRCLCLLVWVLALVGSSYAQVSGVVTDSLTREPISFVQVYYEGTSIGAQTDEEGHYYLPSISSDKPLKLIFSSIEYEKKILWVNPNSARRLDIQLKEISHHL